MSKIDDIADEINGFNYDVKAEAVIANLMENGLGSDEFVVNPASTKKRGFSKDIEKAEIQRLRNNQNLLTIHVNRDGLYDALPEGLFHSPGDQPQKNSSEMSRESKKLRTEEKEARAFFLPFENEIFLQRGAIELSERKLLKQFSETVFDQIFPEFWNLDKSLSHDFVSRLVLTLHYAHQIAGNLPLTIKCLEFIIREQVSIRIIQSEQRINLNGNNIAEDSLIFGSARLGETFVCGNDFDDLIPQAVVTIGPLKNAAVRDFLVGGSALQFLECFYNYFMPHGLDVKTIVLTEREKQHFLLGDPAAELILGFNSGI